MSSDTTTPEQPSNSSEPVIISGVACMLGGLLFWTSMAAIRTDMRPTYQKLGIVPPREPVIKTLLEEGGES